MAIWHPELVKAKLALLNPNDPKSLKSKLMMNMILVATVPDWIQSLAAVAIVILTGWTLKVLRDYAADTKRISKSSLQQLENSQMPFLAVVNRTGKASYGLYAYWVIQNQGFGPALNVRFTIKPENGEEQRGTVSALGQGEEKIFEGNHHKAISHGSVFSIEYLSLSELSYLTTAKLDNGVMHTQFQRPK